VTAPGGKEPVRIKRAVGSDVHAAGGLELEVTEGLIMEDVRFSIATLRAMGLRELAMHATLRTSAGPSRVHSETLEKTLGQMMVL
jgi:hypothetical protein